MSNNVEPNSGNNESKSRKGPLIVLSFFLVVAVLIGIAKQ